MSVLTRSTDLSPREIHDILRNDRRRAVIKNLENQIGEISLRELSEQVAERESGESPAPRELRRSVYNSLHQTHLPKLDEQGIIEYDSDKKTIEPLESARHVHIYMEVVTRYGISWVTYYRSLGVLAMFCIVLVNTNTPVVSEIPTLGVAVFFLIVFLFSTIYQLWSRRKSYFRPLFE